MIEKKNINIIKAIKDGDQKLLKKLYDDYRQPFIIWSYQLYQCNEQDAIEVFQKAYTILYMNIRNGKLVELTSTIKTYLFSIGKNLFREQFRNKHNNTVNLDDISNTTAIEQCDSDILDKYQNKHQKKVVRKLLEEIGDPCHKLLDLLFIKGYSTEATATAMGYSDVRGVRKRKSLCLKTLREKVAKEKKSDFY